MSRRLAAIAVLAALGAAVIAPSAGAHALVVASEPGDGARLEAAPDRVRITFTEEPDLAFSSISVLDGSARAVHRGDPSRAPGDPRTLTISLGAIGMGVYSVSWRVLSKVDGHITAGAYAFGVGASPDAVDLPDGGVVDTPDVTPLGVGGRWLFYAGMFVLVGAAWVGAVARERAPALRALATGGVLAAIAGAILVALAQRADAGIGFGDIARSSIGQSAAWRLAPLAVALIALRFRGDAGRRIAGIAALATIAAHARYGHAGAGTAVGVHIVRQALHMLAASVWIGGLAATLVAIRGAELPDRARVVRRFSTVALFAVAVLASTGVFRAITEIGGWSRVFSTTFGRLVVAKVCVLAVLVGLGALNRFRNVARVADAPGALVAVSRGELALAGVVLVLTGTLTSVAPAKDAGADARARTAVRVGAQDFAGTVRASLTVSPGMPGANRFTVRVSDPATGRAFDARRVALIMRFRGPGEGISQATIELARARAGVYEARGSHLALPGIWTATVLVQTDADATEIPLTFGTAARQRPIEIAGDPVLYTVALSSGRSVQFYVEPAGEGAAEVHATFFDTGGVEFTGLSATEMTAFRAGADPRALSGRALSPGHFVFDAELARARWRFDVSALAPDGARLTAHFETEVRP